MHIYVYYIYKILQKKTRFLQFYHRNHAQRLWPVAAGHRQIGRDRGGDAGAKGSQRAAGQGTTVK